MTAESAVKTGFPGIWIHGKSVRVDFMHKGTRHRHTLGIEPTKVNLRHAARLRTAALYALKTGACNEAEFSRTRVPRTPRPRKASACAISTSATCR